MANKKESTLYYFYSVGCGFCKKVDPIVDELNSEGHEILKLDLAEPDNQGLKRELEQKYSAQCGTPWFIDGETGNQVCGFREKDILEKWVNGEEIPAPPRPKSPPPKVPFHGAKKSEVNKWKKEYAKWCKDNEHLPKIQTAEEVLARPRPKSDPPRPPAPGAPEEQLNEWSTKWDKWREENSHLPNLQTSEQILARMQAQQQGTPGAPPAAPVNPSVQVAEVNELKTKVDALDKKMTMLLNHLGVKHS